MAWNAASLDRDVPVNIAGVVTAGGVRPRASAAARAAGGDLRVRRGWRRRGRKQRRIGGDVGNIGKASDGGGGGGSGGVACGLSKAAHKCRDSMAWNAASLV